VARALSTATLSLGLVAIPVGLHATRRRSGKVSYHLVHAKDGSRVKRQYVCEEEGTPVPDDELARSYQSDDGEEVVMEADEARAIAPKATGRIDLMEFVPTGTVDAIYFDNAYFLAPGKGGARAYHLFAATLRELGVVGVGTQLARGKSYLVAIRATELGMTMHTLHHADEVHAEQDVPHGDATRITAAERDLARTLVEQLRRPSFDPSRFEDEAEVALKKAIAEHAPTPKKSKAAPASAGGKAPKVVDLMASLRASLEASAGGKRAAKRGTKSATANKAPKRTASAAKYKRPTAAKPARAHTARSTTGTPRQRRSSRSDATP